MGSKRNDVVISDTVSLSTILLILASIHIIATLFETIAFREDIPQNNEDVKDNEITESTNLVTSESNGKEEIKLQDANSNTGKTMEIMAQENKKDRKKTKVWNTPAPDLKGCELMRTSEFWLVAMATIFSMSVDKTFFYNMGTYIRSFQMEDREKLLLIGGPILAITSKLMVGILVHVLQDKTQRMTFICFALSVKSVTQGMFTVYGDNFSILCLTTVSVYFCMPLEFIVAPIIMMEYYGAKYYARNWGSILFVSSLTFLLLEALLGFTYDRAIKEKNKLTCYGIHCFYASNIVLLLLTITAFFASLAVWHRRR